MGKVEAPVAAGSDVKLISGGQIVSKMLKQEGVKKCFWAARIGRQLRNFRRLPQQYPLERRVSS